MEFCKLRRKWFSKRVISVTSERKRNNHSKDPSLKILQKYSAKAIPNSIKA